MDSQEGYKRPVARFLKNGTSALGFVLASCTPLRFMYTYTIDTTVVLTNSEGQSMNYITEIESRVAGIPCIIGVVEYECVKGSYSRNAASDWDYYGYADSTWEVLDRRGRPAPWLQRKVGDDDVERIESEIAEVMQRMRDDYDVCC